MATTDPRALINLLHTLGDRIGRGARELTELSQEAKWLQAQMGEQVSRTEHAAQTALTAAEEDHTRAKGCVVATEDALAAHAVAVGDVQGVVGYAADVARRAAAARERWERRVEAAETALQAAREKLFDAQAALAECQQPVYGRGPQGQPVVRYRDCSAYRSAVASADRELTAAHAHLRACRASLAEAAHAEGLAGAAVGRGREALAEVRAAAGPLQIAQARGEEAGKAAGAEMVVGREAAEQAVGAAQDLREAEPYEQRCRRHAGETDNQSRAAARDLAKRIESLELYNRPRPIT